MKPFHRLSSLRAKFFFMVLPPVLGCFLVFSLVLGFFSYRDMRKRMEQDLADFADVQRSVLAEPLWGLSYEILESQVAGMLLNPWIDSVTLADASGEFTTTARREGAPETDPSSLSLTVPVTFNSSVGEQALGTLTITCGQTHIMDALMSDFFRDSALLMLLTTAVVLSAMYANRRTVGLPLDRLLSAIRLADEKNLREPVHWDSPDEIGRVIRAYNTLLGNLTAKEQALAASELSLKSMAANMPGMVFQIVRFPPSPGWGPNDRVTFLSRGVADLFGVHYKAVLNDGVDLFESAGPTAGRRLKASVERSMAGRRPVEDVFEAAPPSGERKWLQAFLRSHQGESGETVVDGLVLDVTGRKRAEEALKESEERYRHLIENLPVGLFRNTPGERGRFTLANPALVRMFGFDSQESFLSTPVADLYQEPAERKVFSDEIMRNGHVVRREIRLTRRDGTPLWGAVTAKLIQDEATGEFSIDGMIEDVTAKKHMEEELLRAKEAAEQASCAKSDFLAGMSHEIRTPMNAILGMADLLWESPLNHEQQKYVRIFRNAGESLLELINDILDLSKVESGQVEMERAPFNLRDAMERVCEVMAAAAHGKNLELMCRVPPDTPVLLLGDSARLRQILVNLVGNAVKFTHQGEVELSVSANAPETNAESGGTELLFTVRDTGIGIPADKVEQIFESFTQADSSTTRKYGGTGLGLAICKRLVEMMGGRIWVESEPNRGSSFRFTARFETDDSAGTARQPAFPDLRGLRVLAADDNPVNRLILTETLASWGMEAEAVEDGERILERMDLAGAEGRPPDLIILDEHMPGLDGFATAERILERSGGLGNAVMLLSSDNSRNGMGRLGEAGIGAFLVKPVKRDELREAAASVLGMVQETRNAFHATENEPVQGPPRRILLVEDNENNRMLFSFYFKKTPHHVDYAANGEEGVEQFASERYDMVFMDIEMPTMDGYEATRRIRRWEREHGRKPVPILALTAHALQEKLRLMVAAGCDGHLTKPVQKRALFQAVERYGPRSPFA